MTKRPTWLIGYPRASGMGFEVVGKSDLSTIILASGYGARGMGDLVGKKHKRARARASGRGR